MRKDVVGVIMKRTFFVFLTIVLALSLVSCKADDNREIDISSQNDVAVTATSDEETVLEGTTSAQSAKATTSVHSAQGTTSTKKEATKAAAGGNTTTDKKETGTTTANVGMYTVTFDLGYEGKSFVAQSKNYKVAKPEDPVRAGYVFRGWYPVNESTPWSFAGHLVTEDVTLVAKWSLLRTTRTTTVILVTETEVPVKTRTVCTTDATRPTIDYSAEG